MDYKFKTNKVCLFHDKNQGDEEITRMMCTIYFAFINAKYNGVIQEFTEDQIKEVAKRQYEKWEFDYQKWAYLSKSVNSVYDYIRNDMGIECSLGMTKLDSEALDWIERGFAVWIGIKVNNIFYNDKLDGKLDMADYQVYKWEMGHATNIIKWNCRGGECSDMGTEYILDSYFTKNSLYECNIKEVLEDIAMTTKYVIF